jgi:hypothetical protein
MPDSPGTDRRGGVGGGGNVTLGSKVGEEGLDFGSAHLPGMAFLVEKDVPSDPIQVGFFGAIGVVFGAERIAHLVEEFFGHGN